MAEHQKEMLFGILAAIALVLIMAAPIIVKCTNMEKCLLGLM